MVAQTHHFRVLQTNSMRFFKQISTINSMIFKTMDNELKVFGKTILTTTEHLKNLETVNATVYNKNGQFNLQGLSINTSQSVSNFTKLNNAFKAYNGNLTKSTQLQNAYIKAVGNQNGALGNYLAGLNGAKASMGGYIKSLVGAKAATIGLQVASTLLNTALSLGLSLALSAIVSGITHLVNKEKEAREQAIENAQTAKEEADNLTELLNKYNQLSEEVKTNTGVKDDLLETQGELLESLGIEQSQLDGLIKKYGDLNTAINKVTLDSLNDAQADLMVAVDAREKELINVGKDYKHWFSLTDRNLISTSGEESKQAYDILAKAGVISQGSVGTGGGVFTLVGDDKTVDGILENYQKLKEAQTALNEAVSNGEISKEDMGSNPLYKAINSRLDELKTAVDNYNFAIKDVNENSANQEIISNLIGKDLPQTEEEFETFKQSLIDSAQASNNFIGSQEDIKNSIIDALAEMPEFEKYFEDLAQAESDVQHEIPISFTDALNSSEYADIKEKLIDLAKSGEITSETLSSTQEYNTLLEKVGISAESAKDQILDMLSVQERLAGATQGLDKLKSAYEEFKNKDVGFVTAETLESLPDVFKNLPDFDLFSKIVGNPESGKEKIQQAFNDIVKSYLSDQETLQGLVNADSATIQTYIANLKQMGITNAEEVVRTANEALNSDNEMINAAEKEYNKYLKGKLKGGEKFLESTASNNSKLKNALGSTYKSDYDNWCDLLSKKADAYNEFVKAIGGSYDDSKNVAQNLVANNGAFGANEYAEAQAAYDKWKQTKKQADDLKNSLKLDYSQITTNFGANWSPTTKKSKSKSKTKSDAAEVFDFIEIKLNNLTDKASKAKDKIDDLLTFGQKKNQTKKAIEATTKAITAQEKAYKKYMAYANKAAKTQNGKKTTSSSSSTGGNALYDEATNYLGLKYVWGGASLTKGADCSGFTQQIYKKFGVSLPHHAADQAKMGTKITSKKNLQAGDLVFFGSKNNITHVGIYGGDGKFIESPHTGASVRVSKLSSRKDFVSGSRFSKINNVTSTSSSSGRNVKKVKGVSSKTLEHYKKLIREGTLGSDGIASIKNENLKNALKDYQTYYEKAKACKEQVASLTDQLKDLYETLANNPIDSASDKIEKLGTKMDILNAKVGNLTFDPTKKIGTSDIDGLYKQIIKNYNSQLSASKTAYTGATKSYNSNKSSLTKSLKKTKAKNIGLTQKEFNSIKSNLKSNKSISYNLINKIENDTLRKKCIAHNEYLLAKNTATDNYNQAKEDHTSNVRQTRKDRFDKVQERYDNKTGLIEQRKNAVSNSLNIAEAQGQLIGEAYYTRQANAVKSDMKLKQEEAGKLAKKLSTIKFGSNEWYEAQEALNGVYEAIQQDEQELAEFQKSINELKFDRFDELLNKLGDITDETDFLIDMLDSDNLFDSDTGMITQDGITAIGLTAQNYDVYLAEAEEYKQMLSDVKDMYDAGTISLGEYEEYQRKYSQSQRDAIKNANEAKKAVISYVKDGLDAQNKALEEAVNKQKELLQQEKD